VVGNSTQYLNEKKVVKKKNPIMDRVLITVSSRYLLQQLTLLIIPVGTRFSVRIPLLYAYTPFRDISLFQYFTLALTHTLPR